MNDTVTPSVNKEAARPQTGRIVLPQWALDFVRTLVGFFSRILWKIDFEGVENIPTAGGVIVAANHQTYIDPFWISVAIKRPTRYLAWSVAFNWPLVGRCLTLFGAWPLQVEGSDPSAIRRTLQWLRNGGAVVIFPEGARSTSNGEMDRFKGGAVRLALEAKVPILPVTVRGGNHVWPRGWRLPHTGKVVIIYHPLHHAEQSPEEEKGACARRESERLAEIIETGLQE